MSDTHILEAEQERFTSWLQHTLSVSLADKTLFDKGRFLGTLVHTYGLDIKDFDPVAVAARITEAGTSALSKKTYKTVLKQYCAFRKLPMTEELELALKHQRGQARKKVYPKDLVTQEELKDIIEHTQSAMLRAYYAVLWDTGARPSGLIRLNVSDVTQDRNGFVLHIRKAKTQQSQRSVRLLTPLAIQYLSVWWSMHPDRKDPDAPLFVNRLAVRVKVRTLLNALRQYHNARLGRGNGTGKAPLSLYLFRKSRATQLLKEERLSDIQIKMRLGHKKHSQMLEQYYAIIDDDDQQEAELAYLGVVERQETKDTTIICNSCGAVNEADAVRCHRCRFPLTEEALIQDQRLDIRMLADALKDPEIVRELVRALKDTDTSS